ANPSYGNNRESNSYCRGSEIAIHATRNGGDGQCQQYGETEGLEALKVRLVELMAEEGIRSEAENVLITTGSQQALDLLGRIFIDPGDTIVMEGPSYIGALGAFLANGPEVITIPLDDMGMRTDLLESELDRGGQAFPKFVYVVPNFHNPAGVTMHPTRREHLLELAERYDLLIIEDNPYGLLRFEGDPFESLVSRGSRRVVYLGTLSKIVSPGIRVGWVFAPAPIIEKITALKQSADLCSSTLNQMFAESYLARGLWRKNLEILMPIYRSRRDAMLQALEEHFPEGASWTKPRGGLFIWVTLPEYLDTAKMLPLAIEQKVAYVPGDAFYADGSGANNMRLNFSFPSEEQIAQGIECLGKVIRKEMDLYHSLGLDR
ncbi:MAG: PLP-dependent aminotransferase family protein, partial [Actinomycetota bacterium]